MRKLLTLVAIAVVISIAAIAQRGFAELQQLAKKGDVTAMEELAHKYDSVGNKEEAMKWTEKASKKGSLEAKYRLAMAYIKGEGKGRNTGKGAKLLREAAVAGNVKAQVAMAEYSLSGLSGYEHFLFSETTTQPKVTFIRQNNTEAARWYLRAAGQGDEYSLDKVIQYQYYLPDSDRPQLEKLKSEYNAVQEKRRQEEAKRQMFGEALRDFTDSDASGKARAFWNFADGKSKSEIDSFFQFSEKILPRAYKMLSEDMGESYFPLDSVDIYAQRDIARMKEIYQQGKEASLTEKNSNGSVLGQYVDTYTSRNRNSARLYKDNGKYNLVKGGNIIETCDSVWSVKDNAVGKYSNDRLETEYLALSKDGTVALYGINEGQIIIPFGKYTDIYLASSWLDLGWVIETKSNGKKHFGIWHNGKELVAPVYTKMEIHRYGYLVWNSKGIGVINKSGKIAVAPGRYTAIGGAERVNGNWIVVYNGKKLGLVNLNTGKQIVPPVHDRFLYTGVNCYCFSTEMPRNMMKLTIYGSDGKVWGTRVMSHHWTYGDSAWLNQLMRVVDMVNYED